MTRLLGFLQRWMKLAVPKSRRARLGTRRCSGRRPVVDGSQRYTLGVRVRAGELGSVRRLNSDGESNQVRSGATRWTAFSGVVVRLAEIR